LFGGLCYSRSHYFTELYRLTLTEDPATGALAAEVTLIEDSTLQRHDTFYYNTYIYGSDGHIWVPGREALHVFDRETLRCIKSDESFGYDKLTK
jgi:hypothetical protein